jgi:inhibitor of cysteine peptidase
MHKVLLKIGILSLLLLFVISCAGQAATTPSATTVKKHSNPSQTILASVGEQFEINLDANETTGYSWKGNEVYSKEYLQLVSSQYVPGSSDRVGAGGTQVYLFKALKAGSTQIALTYKRSWEKTESDKTLTFNVTIK